MGNSPINRIRRSLGGQTSLEGALDAMGKEREEQVLARILEFTDLVVSMVDKLADMFQHYTSGDFEACQQAALELDQLESDADDRKLEISDRLASSGVFSMGRADLARLVTSVDRIANLAAGAADRLVLRPFTLPAEFNAMLIEMVKIDVEAAKGCGTPSTPCAATRASPSRSRVRSTASRVAPTRSSRGCTASCSIWRSTSRPFTS